MKQALLVIACIAISSLTFAAEGDAELKQAIALSLTAGSHAEQGMVVKHCKQAIEAGLSDDDKLLANRLAGRMLARRGATFQTEGRALGAVGQATAARQLLQQALANYEEAIRHDPGQRSALLGIAEIHTLPGGDPKRAMAVLEQALAIDKNSSAAYRTRAKLHLQARKFDEAMADLEQARSIEDNNAATWQLLGLAYMTQQQWDRAENAFDRAVLLEPKNTDHLVKRAQLHLVQKKNPRALADLDQALALEPRSIEALQLRVNLLLRSAKHEQALADLDALIEIRPTNRSLANARARLLAQLKQLDARIELLEEQLKTEAVRTTELRLELAVLYRQADQRDKALAMFSRVLSQHPTLGEVRFARGNLYIAAGDRAAAKSDYEVAVKALPNDATLLNNLAWLLATSPQEELRDGKQAVELATRACQLTQHKAPALLGTLSAAHAETGDFEQAIEWAQKASALAQGPLKEQFELELKSYRDGKPYRDTRGRAEDE